MGRSTGEDDEAVRSAEDIAKDFLDKTVTWIGGAPIFDARVLARAYLNLLYKKRRIRRPSTRSDK